MRSTRRSTRWTIAIRLWPFCALPRWLAAFVVGLVAVDLATIGYGASDTVIRGHDLRVFALLLLCTAISVEVTRRAGERGGVIKDVQGVWELPVAILLPPVYALIAPISRIALMQWRVRRAPLYRRVFSCASVGLSYGAASVIYHSLSLPGVFGGASADSLTRDLSWIGLVSVSAILQSAMNKAFIMTAVKGSDPAVRIRAQIFSREPLYHDCAELCIGILVTYGVAGNPLLALAALPVITLVQRSLRHTQLLSESRADSKTGLLNAATWEREASTEISRAVRTGSSAAVVLLDLDRFKSINDTHGHLVGDQVLREVASSLTEVLRDYDLAGRFGGEEFVMLLPQTRAVDAFRIAERVRAHISQLPIYVGGGTDAERVPVTVSIGVAALDAGSRRELTELLSAADAALYRAKASGRDQVQMISTSRGLSAVRPADDQSAGAESTLFSRSPCPAEVAADGAAGPNGNGSSGSGVPGTADHGIEENGEAGPPAARQPSVDGSAHSATTSALPV
jgi:diguanylate cyclase (GGDEF)-like protein